MAPQRAAKRAQKISITVEDSSTPGVTNGLATLPVSASEPLIPLRDRQRRYTLPLEIWMVIVGSLLSLLDLKACRLASRMFCQASSAVLFSDLVIKTINPTTLARTSILKRIIEDRSFGLIVRSLKIVFTDPYWDDKLRTDDLVKAMENLDGLEGFWGDSIDGEVLRALANKCKRLKYLGFKTLPPELEQELRAFKGLKVLDLSLYQNHRPSRALWDNIPDSVKVIRIWKSASLIAEYGHLPRRTEQLQVMDIPSGRYLRQTLDLLIPLHNSHLKELRIFHRWFPERSDMTAWLQECCSKAAFPRLTVLEVHYRRESFADNFNEALLQFVKMHPRLEVLILTEFTHQMIQALGDLPSLKAVQIFVPQYDDTVAELLRSHLPPSLTWMCLNVTAQSDPTYWLPLLKILSRLPHLTCVRLGGPFIHGKIIDRARDVAEHLPVVEYIAVGWAYDTNYRATHGTNKRKVIRHDWSSDTSQLLAYYRPALYLSA